MATGWKWIPSSYGKSIYMLTQISGYYLADIGVLGDLFKFGGIFVIGELIMFFRLIRAKLPEEYSFIRYDAIGEVLTMFTGAGLGGASIGLLCMAMYMSDVKKDPN